MKVIVSLALLSLAACEGQQPQEIFVIDQPPVPVPGSQSRLPVPTSCPIYVEGEYDVITNAPPLPPHATVMCAIDDTGRTYGLVVGDLPSSHQLAVVPGGHEIGFYVGFEAGSGFTPDRAVLDGTNPGITAFAGPTDVSTQDCCPEGHPEDRLVPKTVAVSDAGWLISLGVYDESATQVALILNDDELTPPDPGATFWTRFYVNGTP